MSVCIITGGRARLLDACLSSLRAQHTAPPFEVLVCENGGRGGAETVRRWFPEATVGRLQRAPLGAARNFLVERARGEWLLFLDDDVTFAPDLLARLAAIAGEHPRADVLGGPNGTPHGSGRFQVVQGCVLSSIVASGPVRRRYGPHPPGPAGEESFTLCNLAVRRSVMHPFPHELRGAEENAVLHALHREGREMYYDPTLAVFHERRPTVGSFARQMLKYGRGRGQLIRRQPRSLRLAYCLAPLMLVGLAASVAAAAATSPLFLVPPVVYLAAVSAGAFKVGLDLRRWRAAALAGALIVVVHWCYGVGVVWGLATRSARRPAPAIWLDEPVSVAREEP